MVLYSALRMRAGLDYDHYIDLRFNKKVGVFFSVFFYGSGFSLQNVSQLLISIILCDSGFHLSVLPKQSADLRLLISCHRVQTNYFLQTVLRFLR